MGMYISNSLNLITSKIHLRRQHIRMKNYYILCSKYLVHTSTKPLTTLDFTYWNGQKIHEV